MEAFVIGLAGGSASGSREVDVPVSKCCWSAMAAYCPLVAGKTTVSRKIIEALHVDWVSLVSMDSFYKVLTPAQHEQAAKNEYNFDHPGV